MKYLLKQVIIPLIYLLFMASIAIVILTINNDLIWLKVILCLLNLGLYGAVVGPISFKEGETALKVRISNDVERMQIIKTGEDRPLKVKEEYKAWKGFAVGAITCLPLVILLIVHAILTAINPELTGAGAVANFWYLTFGAFIRLDSSLPVQPWHFYFNLIALVILPLLTGIPYMLGARRVQLQQEMIKERQRQIYGDSYGK